MVKTSQAITIGCAAVATCAVAAYLLNKRATRARERANWKQAQSILEEFRDRVSTPIERLQQIVDDMVQEMHTGLAIEGKSKLKMLQTFVDNLPTGEEEGLFYALDLGGTNFRVLRVQLGGKEHRILKQEQLEVSIPPSAMVGSNEELFDFIASGLAAFVADEGEGFQLLPGQKRVLGFTFSFPVQQTAIDAGTLLKWTKGFAIAESVGRDVVEELQAAMHRKGVDMTVAALVNDTVGTLAGGRYKDDDVMMGIILGTGTNACYVENVESIPKWQGPYPNSGCTVINMEWGNFASPSLPMTEVDDALDSDSVNPGEQTFEKMLSGMYLGDIVRRVLCKLAEQAEFFGDKSYPRLLIPFVLRTPDVSAMHADTSPDLKEVTRVLKTVFGIKSSTLAMRKMIVDICDAVAQRGARLSAAGVVAILQKIGRANIRSKNHLLGGNRAQRTVVAMDGGLYEHYTHFREYLKAAIVDLIGKDAADLVKIELCKDGSGIGGTLLAAAAVEQKKQAESLAEIPSTETLSVDAPETPEA